MRTALTEPRAAETKNRPYVVGVDAGVNTGLGCWDRRKDKIIWTMNLNFVSAINNLRLIFPDRSQVIVFVELPPRFVYERNTDENGRAESDSMAMAIGGNRREAQLLAMMLRENGFLVREVPPVQKKKWDQAKYEMFTRRSGATTQHERDAARLAIWYAHQR